MSVNRIVCLSLLVLAGCELSCSHEPDKNGTIDIHVTDAVADRMGRFDLAGDIQSHPEVYDAFVPEITPEDLVLDGEMPDSTDSKDTGIGGDAVDIGTTDILSDLMPADLPADSTVPLAGFGTLSGECGVLDDVELLSATPWLFVNSLDFSDDPYDESDFELLSQGGQKVLLDDNAGGSSTYSEVFAFEVLHRCELAGLLKTEMEIIYEPSEGKITDLLVTIDGRKIGVSVTRAVGFPKDAPYTVEQAQSLLDKKLAGILDSSSHVAPEDQWVKQILHILAYEAKHADSIAEAYSQTDPALLGNTIVVVTVTDGDDLFIYE